MYELTVKAFNLADQYRVPVFLMADETIGHMREKILIPDTVGRVNRKPLVPGTLPFKADADLIPGFGKFGTGQHVHVTGLTHDERGYPCATNPKLHFALVQRLVDKIAEHILNEYKPQSVLVEVKKFTIPQARFVSVSTGQSKPVR